ncbi:ABC transporter [Loigolactobacillus binensis]|uniref:ABC transporter n=1 Tax=Loigolactobacillus binensis TaxID=2559922 RepID=A0ABW3EAH0_9LACO|nr:ABC transporter [Loigolactobacillus binensis]
MFSFYPTKNQTNFLAKWQAVFAPAKLYFLYLPQVVRRQQVIKHYHKLFMQHHLNKRLGIVSAKNDVLLPYLSVRENIMLNRSGSAKKKQQWQQGSKHDFFAKDASELTSSERFYVQLYRNVFAGKDIILIDATLDDYLPAEMRAALIKLNQLVETSHITLIFLTANQELLNSEHEQSLHTIPFTNELDSKKG